MKSLFPSEMMSTSNTLTLESIASRYMYFHIQLHLLHWQTSSYATHKALGHLYEDVYNQMDDVIERIMGYTGRKVKSLKLEAVTETSADVVINNLISFANELVAWADTNKYQDVSNLGQSLSGLAAKAKYLLTLS